MSNSLVVVHGTVSERICLLACKVVESLIGIGLPYTHIHTYLGIKKKKKKIGLTRHLSYIERIERLNAFRV